MALCNKNDPNYESCLDACTKTITLDSKYEESYKTSYLKSCLATSGNKQKYCECTLKYLEDANIDLKDISKTMEALPQAVENCKTEIQ